MTVTVPASTIAGRILSVMEPGRWYLPHEVKRAAGIDRSHPHYGDILTRMCWAGLLIHGNGITTRGFCRPA